MTSEVQPELPGQDVEPFVPLVGLLLGLAPWPSGGHDHLVGLDPSGPAGERQERHAEAHDRARVAERWGIDVLHCPYCHGHEVAGQPIGVLGTGPMAVHQALLWRNWSADVTLFRHTAPEPTDEQWEQLAAREIAVVDGKVTNLQVSDNHLTGVRLATGQVVPRRALTVTTGLTVRSDLLSSLGLETTELEIGGTVIGRRVPSAPTCATDVPGVWVAGNASDPLAQVITSAAGGLSAEAALNADLIAEEVAGAVAARRARTDDASLRRTDDGR